MSSGRQQQQTQPPSPATTTAHRTATPTNTVTPNEWAIGHKYISLLYAPSV